MSLDYTIYVGPFIRCKYHSLRLRKQSYVGCPKCDCPRTGAFCSTCGTQIVSMIKAFEAAPSHHDVAGEDVFWELNSENPDNGEVLLAPNHRILDRKTSFDAMNTSGIIITSVDLKVKDEIAVLKAHYAKELKLLTKAFDAVTVEWGIINDIR